MTKATIQRQKLIASFIDTEKISSQNQLKGMLKKKGVFITQATLSRDLSEIGAIKKRIKNGGLIYLLPKHEENNAQKKIALRAIKDFVLEVRYVSNQVIVKTTTAAAKVTADSIDNLYLENVIASLAGDNVVLIITPGPKEAQLVAKTLEGHLN